MSQTNEKVFWSLQTVLLDSSGQEIGTEPFPMEMGSVLNGVLNFTALAKASLGPTRLRVVAEYPVAYLSGFGSQTLTGSADFTLQWNNQ